MEKPRITTPVLEYWGFKQHPFDDYILRGKRLNLFVNREDELHQLHNSLSNRLTGVYGSQGVGKSSFLRKFEQILRKSGLSVAYVHLTGTTEKALYREILSTILSCHIEGSIKTTRKMKLNSKRELERVEFSIRLTKESELGAAAILKGSLKESTEKQIDPHTEESARALIRDIILNTRTAFVVIVDDLERMKHFLDGDAAYFRFISSFARTVDESFSDESVAFVVSLDEGFVSRLATNPSNAQGTISFSFGELAQLKCFKPQQLVKIIKKRLNGVKWQKALTEFISIDAFWTLVIATGGHARRSLAVLRAAMEYVERNKKQKKIDIECIKEGMARRGEIIDDKDLSIVQFLSDSGPHSASDKDFQNVVGLTRKPLLDRLKILTSLISLKITKEATGTTTKDLYSLPEIRFDD
jgi:Cdc6-like AAA superfamily ATPase